VPDIALDLRYLRYAMLVAEQGSFGRVAALLDVSQSTISRGGRILERRLGAPLFERDRSGARLTRLGERFMRDAAIGAEHLRRAIRDATSGLPNRSNSHFRLEKDSSGSSAPLRTRDARSSQPQAEMSAMV
jgi:DNA-binding transcriptional LysR family regulator